MLNLWYITNNAEIALIAENYGVDVIWIDLEILGKEERQKNLDSVKSRHSIEDIKHIKPLLTKSQLMVRINPWNHESVDEINAVVRAGADSVMLPMWKTAEEVKCFIKAVDGRAKTVLLLETKEAENCLDEVLKLGGIDRIHIGLNDLHLSYGLTFMFELLADGTVERICAKIKAAGISYGFGGIARIGEGVLPAEKILLEHYRLGSSATILSRSFCNAEEISDIDSVKNVFKINMAKLREFEEYASAADGHKYKENIKEIKSCVNAVVKLLKECQNNG